MDKAAIKDRIHSLTFGLKRNKELLEVARRAENYYFSVDFFASARSQTDMITTHSRDLDMCRRELAEWEMLNTVD